MFSLFLLSSIFVASCLAHKDGAPTSACLTMTPGHAGTSPQELSSAVHRLEFSPSPSSSANATPSYVLTLSPKSSATDIAKTFKGFFVQARSTTSGDANPVGKDKSDAKVCA